MSELFVCIFPHDKQFESESDLQKWLLNDFIKRDEPGRYLLRKIGLKDKDFISRVTPGSLILFRKGEYIVGEGTAKTGIKPLNPPVDEVDGKYYNEIFVSPQSVRIYDLPVSAISNWSKREQFTTNLTKSQIQTGRYYLIVGSRGAFEKEFADRFLQDIRQPVVSYKDQEGDNDWTTGENIAEYFPPDVNAIPGKPIDRCFPTLMVAIGSTDNLEARILEAAYHVNVSCLGKNKKVVFEAAKWESETWRKHAKKFNNLEVILRIKGAYSETILV